jgi:hypothetical protein
LASLGNAVHLILAIDATTVERARLTAECMGTSLENLVCRYLESLAGPADATDDFQEFRGLCLRHGGHSGGHTWKREDLHPNQDGFPNLGPG